METKANWESDLQNHKARIRETLDSLGLSISEEFVPFSQSRNKDEKQPSLNWIVTVLHNGREILKTDYMAGMAHCPGYKAGMRPTLYNMALIEYETEQGYPAYRPHESSPPTRKPKSQPIKPDAVDLFYSLSRDSDVLDYAGFEDWAFNFGYDTDSRKAESIYRECLEIALKLRAAIGDDGLKTLMTAFEDY